MRLVLVIVLSVAASAQTLPVPTDQSLSTYLGLTQQQLMSSTRLRVEFARMLAGKSARVAIVNRELADERAKSQPDPYQIGLRYIELDSITREVAEAEVKLRAGLRQQLTPEQVAKLQPLEEAQRLRILSDQAVCEGFIAAGPAVTSLILGSLPSTAGLPASRIASCGVGIQLPF